MLTSLIEVLPRPRVPAPTLAVGPPIRFAGLYHDGELVGMVPVEPQGMVDLAVSELGARLVAVGWVIPAPPKG